MSDAYTVSPLLDEYSLGKLFSSHNGITCCPAIHSVTKEKFIVKKISLPESQVQVDALLLTGSCQNKGEAQDYFAQLGEDLVSEIHVLDRLSETRGFAPFSAFQVLPKDVEIGVDLWVLMPFRLSLAAFMRRHPMTHLNAVNLGLDLCAALADARKEGFVYQDLKPENIFLTSQKQFQLGDLGFVALDDLSFAAFPQKYRSPYTAPELFDDFGIQNQTLDLYALGMLLYEIYNGGALPFAEEEPRVALRRRLAGEVIPPPRYADADMTEIIGKALAFRPEDRWQSPEELRQALTAYMQKNEVNDSPITPPEPEEPQPEEIPVPEKSEEPPEAPTEEAPEESSEEPMEEKPEEIPEEPIEEEPEEIPEEPIEEKPEEAPEEPIEEEPEEIPEEPMEEEPEEVPEEPIEEEPEEAPEEPMEEEPEPIREIPENLDEPLPDEPEEPMLLVPDEPLDLPLLEPTEESAPEILPEEPQEGISLEPEALEPLPQDNNPWSVMSENSDTALLPTEGVDSEDDDDSNMRIWGQELSQEAHYPEEAAPSPEEVRAQRDRNAELDEILSRADSVLASISGKDDVPEEENLFQEIEEPEEEVPTFLDDDEEDFTSHKAEGEASLLPIHKPSFKKPLIFLAVLAIIAALNVGGWMFYQHIYCVPMELSIVQSDLDSLSVTYESPADPSALVFTCKDTYGNSYDVTWKEKVATISGLHPDTQYTVTASIDGFHKLTGTTTVRYTTPLVAEITSFTALTGSEDGSILLNFTLDGVEPTHWVLTYAAPGKEEQSITFSGHSQMVTGLEVGTEYQFRLSTEEDIRILGNDTVSCMASTVILPQNLRLQNASSGSITVVWDAPSVPVSGWIATCTDGDAYNISVESNSNSATFQGVQLDRSNTIRVSAAGMSESALLPITANPICVSSFRVDDSTAGELAISWEYTGAPTDAPLGDWLLHYSYGEGEEKQEGTMQVSEPHAVLDQVMPGIPYHFSIESVEGYTVFSNETLVYRPVPAQSFSGFGVSSDNMELFTLVAPEGDWGVDELNRVGLAEAFTPGQEIGFFVKLSSGPLEEDSTPVQIVIRLTDANGRIQNEVSFETPWNEMWTSRMYLGQITAKSELTGEHTLEVYFDNQLAVSKPVTIHE